MRIVLTVCLVVFMAALPPLVPRWTPSAVLVMVILELLCASFLVAMWWWRRAEPALRVAAGLIARVFVLAAADQLRAAVRRGTPIVGGRTPVVGLVVIGLPCAAFAVIGVPAGARGSRSASEEDLTEDDKLWEDELDEDDGRSGRG